MHHAKRGPLTSSVLVQLTDIPDHARNKPSLYPAPIEPQLALCVWDFGHVQTTRYVLKQRRFAALRRAQNKTHAARRKCGGNVV